MTRRPFDPMVWGHLLPVKKAPYGFPTPEERIRCIRCMDLGQIRPGPF